MGKTKIEWATDVWNPVTGCTKVSQGCKHCYAERFARRMGKDFSQVELHPERMAAPLHWKKPRRVFVNSMSDLFHERVPDEFIWDILRVAIEAKHHTFLILTKRAERMLAFFGRTYWRLSRPDNIWFGVSVEDQRTADERIPLLLKTPVAKRFISAEPLLGAIDLRQYLPLLVDTLDGPKNLIGYPPMLDWVIVGGESGPGARPMHPDWARSIRDQCQAVGVPFFFKQWGEWTAEYPQISMANRASTFQQGSSFYRVGKRLAGRLLDGVEWSAFPPMGDKSVAG